MSDNLDEAKVFCDAEGRDSVRMEIGFGDFHSRHAAYRRDSVKLTGKPSKSRPDNSQQITRLESL